VLVFTALALGLGLWGFHKNFGDEGSFWDKLYASLQLFVLEFSGEPPISWQLQVARILAPTVAVLTAVIAILAVSRQQIAEFFARRQSGHIVVCGLGPCGASLAKGFHERGDDVVAIEASKDNRAIEECRDAGITVVVGDARDRSVLVKAGMEGARYAVATCGSDAISAEVTTSLRAFVREPKQTKERNRKGLPLDCFVHMDDVELCARLEDSESWHTDDPLWLHYFNPSESAAAVMLIGDPVLEREREPRVEAPHILVVGMHQMGSRIVLHAARCWRFGGRRDDSKLPVTIVDREADARVAQLGERYRWLDDACVLEPKQLDVDADAGFLTGAFLKDIRAPTSVYVCLDRDDRGLRAALSLHRHLRDLPGRGTRVVVRTAQRTGLATLLPGEGQAALGGPVAFGLVCGTCTPQMLLNPKNEILAQAIHAAARARQRREAKPGEAQLREWGDLEEDDRESRREEAEQVGERLRRDGYYIVPLSDHEHGAERVRHEDADLLIRAELRAVEGDPTEILAQAIHEDYLARQLASGRKRQETAALTDWGPLPEDYKRSNRAQAKGYKTTLEAVGCEIVSIVARVPGLVAFTSEEVETMAVMEHQRWYDEKVAEGWRWGERSEEDKLHPDLLPWAELQPSAREKDRNTMRGIPRFLERVGFAVARKRR
jgi:TrkA-N domain/RyR domain